MMQVQPIEEEKGYIRIKLNQIEIASNTDTILHIINPEEILKLLREFEINMDPLSLEYKSILGAEIKLVKSKVGAIMQQHSRKRRGLINVVGTIQRWLFGTMDDEDRENILNQMEVIEKNNHNVINTLNNQVIINSQYNTSLNHLKQLLVNDRLQISTVLNETNDRIRLVFERLLFIDLELKIRFIQSRVNQILDNIVSTQNNIIHPSMLTLEELETYKVDFHKLKLLKAGVLRYNEEVLIFAIKIPRDYIVTELELIQSIPNSEFLEIDHVDELVVKVDEVVYKYEKNVILNKLKVSTHCILSGNCKLRFNNQSELIEIDDETILAKNMVQEIVTQTCNKKEVILKGNYLINFNNCSVKIRNQMFKNSKFKISERYFYPSYKTNNSFVKPLNFEKITIEHIENIKEIKELEYKKNIIQWTTIITSLLSIIIISIILYWKIDFRKTSKPEAFVLKEEGVICTDKLYEKISRTEITDSNINIVKQPTAW